ncbi:heterokaryon incompatibility protein-domain-containing protein [Bipolaris maydis]|nr:heterokaryon incompatibility protein-domain-containing protein [Bipolaris maydis]KAJ6266781.1 heterokaryon incompatibility protein-domain-containing protein [Bipolaris maydis]
MSILSNPSCRRCRAQSVSQPTYSPLEADEIRVLRILPTTILPRRGHNYQDDIKSNCEESFCIACDMIQCELVTVSLKEVSGAFDALSYVWGYASVKEQIKMDGEIIEVTCNLEAALRRIRNTEKAKLLWVDALCINQQDTKEKNIQVMRMKDIYTMCARVLVWLGDVILDGPGNDNNEVDAAINAIAFLKKAHRIVRGKDTVGKQGYEDFPQDPILVNIHTDQSSIGLPTVDSPEWNYLSKFLNRPWFSRVWIIQEASGVDHTLLMVGKDARLGWGQLSQVLSWLVSHNCLSKIPGLSASHNFTMIELCRRIKYVPLADRLDRISSFNSTLPHDKIYAVLGLSAEGLTLEEFPRLRIDYTRDWKAVFRDVTRHCIEMPNSLTKKPTLYILSQVRHDRDDDGNFAWDGERSSWVPKWDTTHDTYRTLAQLGTILGSQTTYDTEPYIVESHDDRILSLKGIVVDKIAKVFTHLLDVPHDPFSDFPLNCFRAVVKAWLAIKWDAIWRPGIPDRYPLLGEAFAKIIIQGAPYRLYRGILAGHESRGGESPGHFFCAYWEAGLLLVEDEEPGTLPRFSTVCRPIDRDVEKWLFVEGELAEKTWEWVNLMAARFSQLVSLDRIIFVTETGYIGSGPSITRAGDDLCVLYGGKTPFVVRKMTKETDCPEWLDLEPNPSTGLAEKLQDLSKRWKLFQKSKPKEFTHVPGESHVLPLTDCYRLVGECYVDGLQKGEALDLRDKGDLCETVLHLI